MTGEIVLGAALALVVVLIAFLLARQLRLTRALTAALRDSEQRYRFLFQANPMPMWVRRLSDRCYLDVNEAALRTYGFTRETFLGMKTHDLIPDADRAAWERYQAQGDSGRSRTRISRHRRKDGAIIDVEMTSHPIDYAGQPARLAVVKDITERKRADDSLRESQYFMQKAQEVAHIGYWVSEQTQSGARLIWSPEAHRIFGVSEQDFDGRVETFFSLVHREDLEIVNAERQAALAGERPYRVEHRVVRPDGAVRWVYQEAEITFDDDGKPLQMFGVTQDITERKESEILLRESERRYRFMFEENPIPMWVRDARDGAFLAVNEAAVKLYGYTREEFAAMRGEDIRHEDERAAWREFIQRRDPVERTVTRRRHILKNGELIDVEVTSRGFTYEGRPARLALVKDITEQLRAERAMRESEERYRKTIEMSPSPVLLRDRERITFANRAAQQFFGAGSDRELVGKSVLSVVHPDEHERARERMRRIDETRERTPSEVRKYRRLDGRVVYGESSGTAVPFQEQPLAIVTIHDVTARVEAERVMREGSEMIRRLNAELEQRVAERTAQLSAANMELESFAYSVSHDLRAPLRSIDGFSKALLEDYESRLDAEGQDYLRRTRRATQRMGDLIDDLLALSRVSRVEMRRNEVDLSALAQEIITELRGQDPGRKVTVSIPPAMTVRGDGNLLRIVLHNLLQNAWKFTSTTRSAKIEVGVANEGAQTTFFVRDNGVGFDMAYAGKLFGAFQRLHANTDFPGTGIGLATVQRIVRRHGGTVRAEAAIGKGATIYFTLGDEPGIS